MLLVITKLLSTTLLTTNLPIQSNVIKTIPLLLIRIYRHETVLFTYPVQSSNPRTTVPPLQLNAFLLPDTGLPPVVTLMLYLTETLYRYCSTKTTFITKYMTSNMIFLQILILQWCYIPNFALVPLMHCLQDSLSLASVFEASVPSNMMPSSLTPSSHLLLSFPTLLFLWIICCRTSFAIRCSTIFIIYPAHCNCLNLINAVTFISSFKS